jgi:hypothetical protein
MFYRKTIPSVLLHGEHAIEELASVARGFDFGCLKLKADRRSRSRGLMGHRSGSGCRGSSVRQRLFFPVFRIHLSLRDAADDLVRMPIQAYEKDKGLGKVCLP